MTRGRESRGGFVAFLSTIPGILTACAALITAVGTVAGIYLTNADSPVPGGTPSPAATQATPDATTDDEQVDPPPPPDPPTDPLDNCLAGVIEECGSVLDDLDVMCFEGDPLICDLLYWASPSGSDYEWDGGTCGGYFADLSYAGTCSEQ